MPPKVQKKPAAKKVAENPFDKFANARKKHEVINRRVKGEDRNVGRARSKAIDERKKKLLSEFRTMKKSNTFADRRFGESDASLSLEDKMFMRFQKEKAAKVRNLSMYNLDSMEDTETLTHKGQSLGEATAMDDWPSSEDEGLGREVVENLHFGGGLVHKTSSDHVSDARKSRDDIMQEIVMKSKLRKLEKKEAREAQDEQLETLDKAYAELISGAMLEFKPTKWDRDADDEDLPVAAAGDAEYDTAFRAMAFESRLKATDRTKSQEEIAQEELEKLEALEKERLARMMPQEARPKIAADDVKGKRRRVTDDEVEEDGWGMSDGVENSDEEELSGGSGSDDEENESDDESEEESGSEIEEDSDEEDSMQSEDEENVSDEESSGDENENGDVLESPALVDHINDLMPHILPCPTTYEAFQSQLDKYATSSPEAAVTLVQRILTASSVHLPGDRGVSNKPKMIAFMEILLQYFMSLGDSLVTAKNSAALMTQIDFLSKSLYNLAHDLPDQAATLFIQTLKNIQTTQQKNFKSLAEGKSSAALWPSLGSIFYFQLMGHIYSVSDFRHAIITPLMLYLAQSLSQCPLRHSADAASGLLIASILVQYTDLAKKLLPEVLTFLSSIFKYANGAEEADSSCELNWRCFNMRNASKENIPAIVCTAIVTLRTLIERYSNMSAFPELFSRLYHDLKAVKVAAVSNIQTEVLSMIQSTMKERLATRKPLQWRVQSKFILQTLAPRFEENYTMKKDMDADSEKAKVKQLNRQLKREKKAAVRELRRDADFLDEQMYNEKMALREEGRAERAKNFAWMEEQQATFNQQVRMGKGLMKGGGSGGAPKPRAKRQKR